MGRAESSLLGTSEMRIQNSSDKRRHARHWNENDLPDKRDNKGYLAEVSDLKRQLSELQNKLYEAESKLSSQESVTCRALKAWQTQMDVKEEISKREQDEKDQQMRNIVRRLINVEEELRKEQTELLSMMSTKQKVIEAQEARIQNLDNANGRLLAALSQFREQRRTSYACHPAVPVTTVDSPRSQINSNVPSKDGKFLFDIITDIDYIDDRIDSARQTPNDRYYNSASSNDLRTSSC